MAYLDTREQERDEQAIRRMNVADLKKLIYITIQEEKLHKEKTNPRTLNRHRLAISRLSHLVPPAAFSIFMYKLCDFNN